jgi:uncharacterized membrane protein YphA (DoxX/SURF4 family)
MCLLWRNTNEVSKVTFIAGFEPRSDRVELGRLHLRRWPLQKLFSAFPAGWPGVGLLLLRILVGVTLIAQTVTQVRSSGLSAQGWVLAALLILGASCLLVGFVTPVVAILIALASLANTTQELDTVVLSIAIALLGPGAFSIDARMFGRREILIPQTSRSQKP